MKIKVVRDPNSGVDYLKKLLYSHIDSKTALFLSGGKTPRNAYSKLAFEQKINPGAVAMVDERVGIKNYQNSNRKMIKEAGLLSYLEKKKIPFYPISRLQNYNEKVKYLLENFSKSVAIMGIGEDGHTAGLPSGISNFKFPISNDEDLVIRINNFPGEFRERITLTFKALSKMDLLIVLVFGLAKKKALKLMFGKGSMEEIPARFFTKPQISKKTILITDQKI